MIVQMAPPHSSSALSQTLFIPKFHLHYNDDHEDDNCDNDKIITIFRRMVISLEIFLIQKTGNKLTRFQTADPPHQKKNIISLKV